MNLHDLVMLVDYHYWARDRLLEAVEPLTPEQFTRTIENSFPSIRDTLVHLYGAEVVWSERWEGRSPTTMIAASEFPDLASIRRAWAEEETTIRGWVARLGEEGIARAMEYRTFDGKLYAHPFWQMVQHLVNHGSYHRGQLTMMLRQLGAAVPKQMDLSAFYRENAAARI